MSNTILYEAASIRTMDPKLPFATGLLVQDGTIVAVGESKQLEARASVKKSYPHSIIVPGLIDGHSHPVFGTAMTEGVDLSDALELSTVRSLLNTERERIGNDQWLLAWGLNPVVFGGAEPTAASLGEAFNAGYGVATLYDGHSVLGSPSALDFAGITEPTVFPSSARVAVDDNGNLTGYLLEHEARELLVSRIPAKSSAEQAHSMRKVLQGMAESGLTGIHAMDGDDPTFALLQFLEAEGDLPIRVAVNPRVSPEPGGVEVALALQGLHGRRWRIEGVKFVVDGTIDGGTAWLEYPDTHGEGLDPLWRDFDAFSKAVETFHRAGVNTAIHAIGDKGVREVITLFAQLAEPGPGPA